MSDQGRPTKYTNKIADVILDRIISGESLSKICRDSEIPSKGTVLQWVADEREGFTDRYARACSIRAMHWADEIIDISDDSTNDYMEAIDKSGEEYIKLNTENINRSRLRIDSRKWILAKLLPNHYGDKTEITEENVKPISSITYVEEDASKTK